VQCPPDLLKLLNVVVFMQINPESLEYSSVSSTGSVDSDRVTPEAMVVYGKDEDGDTLLNIAKSENAMLWRMLSRLETCIVYSCI
jgi:hypothetical protein